MIVIIFDDNRSLDLTCETPSQSCDILLTSHTKERQNDKEKEKLNHDIWVRNCTRLGPRPPSNFLRPVTLCTSQLHWTTELNYSGAQIFMTAQIKMVRPEKNHFGLKFKMRVEDSSSSVTLFSII